MPRLWRLMPVLGSTSPEPKPEAFDWISDTPMPLAVDRAEVRRVAVADPAPIDSTHARYRSGRVAWRSDCKQVVAVGGVAEHVGSVVPGGGGRLDQQVGPADVVGVGRQVEPTRPVRRHRASR